jgi:Holliday junction resolvasome RuvABC endonuclease subunit
MAVYDPSEVEGVEKGKVIHVPDGQGFRRLQLIAQNVRATLRIWQPAIVLIENYAIGHVSSVELVVACGTLVRAVLFDLKYPVYQVNVKTLKLWTTGRGGADKKLMAQAVKERWGYVSPSDDVIDAYALARMGQLKGSELMAIKGVTYGL